MGEESSKKPTVKKYASGIFVVLAVLALLAWVPWMSEANAVNAAVKSVELWSLDDETRTITYRKAPFGAIVEGEVIACPVCPAMSGESYFISPIMTVHKLSEK